MELHGGTLSVFSKGLEGEGSTFTVRLPCLLPGNDSSSSGSEAVAAAGGEALDMIDIARSPSSFLDLSMDLPPPRPDDPAAADFPERSLQYNNNANTNANANAADHHPIAVDTSAVNKVGINLPFMCAWCVCMYMHVCV